MSMRWRLFLSLLMVVVTAILATVFFVRFNVAAQLENYLFRGGMVGMSGMVDELEAYYQTYGSWQGVEELIAAPNMMGRRHGQAMGMMMGQQIQLVSTDGNLIYDSSGNAAGDKISQAVLEQAIKLTDSKGNIIGYLLVAGGGALQRGVEQPLLQSLNSSALQAGLVAIVIALGLALVLAARLLRPIQGLTQAARQMATGDLSQRVPVHGSDELSTLATTFNQMAGSLQRSEERRKAMTADIAHELRTPLSVQRAQIEAMLDGVYPTDAENLQKILDQNEFLSRLVEDLRTLALADAGELKLDCLPIDLNVLVSRVADRFQPSVDARRITLVFQPVCDHTSAVVKADPARLEQILNNLLINAIRYSPTGGKIFLRITCGESQHTINVRDTGPGIPADALDHLFERFFRADRARSREAGGTGLGLAIARQLALAHGGDLKGGNHPEGGAEFTLTLPAATKS